MLRVAGGGHADPPRPPLEAQGRGGGAEPSHLLVNVPPASKWNFYSELIEKVGAGAQGSRKQELRSCLQVCRGPSWGGLGTLQKDTTVDDALPARESTGVGEAPGLSWAAPGHSQRDGGPGSSLYPIRADRAPSPRAGGQVPSSSSASVPQEERAGDSPRLLLPAPCPPWDHRGPFLTQSHGFSFVTDGGRLLSSGLLHVAPNPHRNFLKWRPHLFQWRASGTASRGVRLPLISPLIAQGHPLSPQQSLRSHIVSLL